jgi:hypothetical protein
VLDKSALRRMRVLAAGEARSSGELGAVVLHRQGEAAIDATPVDEDGACPALSVFTPRLRARDPETIT